MSKLRNLALISHGGVGKTTLAEALNYATGSASRRGKVTEGNTVSDYQEEEKKRGFSISLSVLRLERGEAVINLVDTPGTLDFAGEVVSGLYAVDAALALVSAVSGVETGTVKYWEIAERRGLPRALFVNRMDRENADFDKTVESIKETFGQSCVPLQLPIGSHTDFHGLVDLVAGKAYIYKEDSGEFDEADIPAELQDAAAEAREQLIEEIAAADEALMEKYFEEGTLPASDIHQGLRAAFAAGTLTPIFVGSAEQAVGAHQLLDAVVNFFPAPEDVPAPPLVKFTRNAEAEPESVELTDGAAALVFKTAIDPFAGKLSIMRVYSGKLGAEAHNVNRQKPERTNNLFHIHGGKQEAVDALAAGDIGAAAKLDKTQTCDTLADGANKDRRFTELPFPNPLMKRAVFPASKGDEDKMSSGLTRLQEEDPTLITSRNDQTNELILAGLGDQHLNVAVSQLDKKYGVKVELKVPRIAYLETITKRAKAQGRHKKQTGGRGQFGDCYLEFWPLESGTGNEFEDAIVGGAIPGKFIPAVEKGLNEAYQKGYLCGCPIVDVHAKLYDGSYHNVDSSEMAFKIAASLAFRKAMDQADPVILEPIVRLEVTIPDEFLGDISGDISSKRGKILGMEPQGKMQVVRALVPEAELTNYATELRSMTGGQGTYDMVFEGYERVPGETQQKIIEEYEASKDN
jgi:elongation factor G